MASFSPGNALREQSSLALIFIVHLFYQVYNKSQHSKRSIHKAIMNGSSRLTYYNQNARMVPNGLNPRCHKMHITVTEKFQIGSKSKAFTTGKSKAPGTNRSKGLYIALRFTNWLVLLVMNFWSGSNTIPQICKQMTESVLNSVVVAQRAFYKHVYTCVYICR